jgi:hypothetical protein
VSFPLSTEGYTPALPVQRQKLSTFMELPAYRDGHNALRGP